MSATEKSCSVLVVEDEPLVRMFVVELLQDADLRVFEAARADEAISVLEAQNGIEVIFTDVRMPGPMDGYALAHQVRKRWPTIKVFLTSGYVGLRSDSLPPGVVFVPKPYDWNLLPHRIKALMSA
jgi:two-component system, response regulator PdtaR